MRAYILIFSIFVSSACVLADDQSANIITKEIVYQVDDTNLTGYLAYNSSIDIKRPGILVVHEWWGHNQYARERAERLAELGYIALAVDMYGDGKLAKHPEDASKFMQEVTNNMAVAEERLSAGLQLLHDQALTDPNKTVAIGYCFGGSMVLHLARIGADIDGVVSFHGSLATNTPAEKGAIKAKVLVLHGDDDPFITREQVIAFKEEMQNAGAHYEFVAYPNVRHSFTNPMADEFSKKFDIPALRYDQYADEDSWNRMKAFIEQIIN